MITTGSLVAAGVAPTQARLFAGPLAAACARFDISSPARVAAFIGQCMVESSRFMNTEEDLYYRRPDWILEVFGDRVNGIRQASTLTGKPQELANVVYAKVNGNSMPGDGWRFRGRGVLQITGRANYADAAEGLGRPYVDQPDLVSVPTDACLTAAWFWHGIKGNILADSWQLDVITRAVNGRAMREADIRRQYSEQALKAMQ